MRSVFARPGGRKRSATIGAVLSFAAVALWLATNASVTAAAGQYKPGLFVKSADVSKDGSTVKVTGTVSCSPAFTGILVASVFQGDNGAFSDVVNGVTCDERTTRFSIVAITDPLSSPLVKGPARVNVSYASLSTQATIDLR